MIVSASVRPITAFLAGARMIVAGIALAGCGSSATLPVTAGTGPHPVLPPPTSSLIPTVLVAEARGWPPGGAPLPAAGTAVNAFASGLSHPRWLYVLPGNGTAVNGPRFTVHRRL